MATGQALRADAIRTVTADEVAFYRENGWVKTERLIDPEVAAEMLAAAIASLPFDRVGGLAFWVALDDVPAERGTMRFLSGSQRQGCLGRARVQGKGVGLEVNGPFDHPRFPQVHP